MPNLILPTLLLLLATGQAIPAQADRPSRPTPETLSLLDQARSLPAEFRADALLRIAESLLIPEKSQKQELIEEAFWSGSRAYLPYMQRVEGRGSDLVAMNSMR